MPGKDVNDTIFKFAVNKNTMYTLGSGEFRNRDFPPCLKACFIENITTDVRDGVVKITRRSTTYVAGDSMMSPHIQWQVASVVRKRNVLMATCSARRRCGVEAQAPPGCSEKLPICERHGFARTVAKPFTIARASCTVEAGACKNR